MFNFKNLFVLDLANNHQGLLSHGLKVINEHSKVIKNHKVAGAIKFQFRQLKSFIHPDHKVQTDQKHLIRFRSTELDLVSYKKLFDKVKINGLFTMCTPFDEESVEHIISFKFDIIKVASCSARDWPLLEKIANAGLPIIFSTGGLELENIDDLVSFFTHRNCDFAIMHCVSLYPIPENEFHLNQIDVLKTRYPNIEIGWSTHEDPNDIVPITMAVAKGASMFERHIGMVDKDISLNAYSSDPDQLENWISGAKKAFNICGKNVKQVNIEEIESINSLKRGVYAKGLIKKGNKIKRDDVFFAMPYEKNQLDSGKWSEGIIACENIKVNKPLLVSSISLPESPNDQIIKKVIHEAKGMLAEAKIKLNSEFQVEYSHHYGISKFRQIGVIIINVINREYCKKILIQLPNQKHPSHHHKLKEETFQVLSGTLDVWVDGKEKKLLPGDTCLVLPGVWHSFSTKNGCVFEEISTTHHNNDSVYKDNKLNLMKREDRKTIVDHWGRFQIPNIINKKT